MPDTDQLTDHNYDGIQEYDNDLPRWWLALLWISVIWAGAYTTWYAVIGMPSGPEALRLELVAISEARARSSTGPLPEELMRELSRNPERIATARRSTPKPPAPPAMVPRRPGWSGPICVMTGGSMARI